MTSIFASAPTCFGNKRVARKGGPTNTGTGPVNLRGTDPHRSAVSAASPSLASGQISPLDHRRDNKEFQMSWWSPRYEVDVEFGQGRNRSKLKATKIGADAVGMTAAS